MKSENDSKMGGDFTFPTKALSTETHHGVAATGPFNPNVTMGTLLGANFTQCVCRERVHGVIACSGRTLICVIRWVVGMVIVGEGCWDTKGSTQHGFRHESRNCDTTLGAGWVLAKPLAVGEPILPTRVAKSVRAS